MARFLTEPFFKLTEILFIITKASEPEHLGLFCLSSNQSMGFKFYDFALLFLFLEKLGGCCEYW